METNDNLTFRRRLKLGLLAIIQMPRMHSSSTQCCLCVVGVFMFLMGVIMASTGVCLILNYGYFDNALFPPELRNEEGKRTVGIILTVTGILCIFISVLVSSIYLCSRSKNPPVHSEELNKIPGTGRKSSAGSKNSRNKVSSTDTVKQKVPVSSTATKSKDMHSTTVPSVRPRHQRKRKKHTQRIVQRSKLEGIQEADAISRKFSEKDLEVVSVKNTFDSNQSEVKDAPPIFIQTADQVVSSDETRIISTPVSMGSSDVLEIDNPVFDNPDTKQDFDRSSTSSGITGSEKTDSLSRVEAGLDH